MVFSSILFMFIYLPVVLAVYYFCPLKWRNIWLFAVNLVFYGWGEPVYIVLMMFSNVKMIDSLDEIHEPILKVTITYAEHQMMDFIAAARDAFVLWYERG